jgi:hypothetical protein
MAALVKSGVILHRKRPSRPTTDRKVLAFFAKHVAPNKGKSPNHGTQSSRLQRLHRFSVRAAGLRALRSHRRNGAKRILEIGTLGAYSGIHFARALPLDGKLITLEIDPHHAEVARRNFERAGVGHKVEVRIGPASEALRQMAAEGEAPFDLIFIDADKGDYTEYLRLSLPPFLCARVACCWAITRCRTPC